jgi:hypothetical protein
VNRTEPDPVQRLFEQVFDEQIFISEEQLPDEAADVVLLLRDDEVVAVSSLASVMDSVLLVNSDIFRTGTAGLDQNRLPDVLANLDNTRLTLRGYPASNKQKLLFIAISREIEARALEADDGRLDAGFQHLLRIRDEFGTQQVYERLGRSNVETHVYGTTGRDWMMDAGMTEDLHVAIKDTDVYRRCWFVVHSSPDSRTQAAFVAWEHEPNVWVGGWTYDPAKVRPIHQYIIGEL